MRARSAMLDWAARQESFAISTAAAMLSDTLEELSRDQSNPRLLERAQVDVAVLLDLARRDRAPS